jgi:hypothetical protein
VTQILQSSCKAVYCIKLCDKQLLQGLLLTKPVLNMVPDCGRQLILHYDTVQNLLEHAAKKLFNIDSKTNAKHF